MTRLLHHLNTAGQVLGFVCLVPVLIAGLTFGIWFPVVLVGRGG